MTNQIGRQPPNKTRESLPNTLEHGPPVQLQTARRSNIVRSSLRQQEMYRFVSVIATETAVLT
jgi:hypothetical protein